MKTFWKSTACRIWIIVTSVLLVVLIVANVLACAVFYDAVSTVLGRSTTKIVGEELNLYQTDEGINSKEDALAYGNEVSKEICEEGFVLLKNNSNALPLASGAKVSVFGKNSVNIAISGSGSGGGLTADYDLYDSLEQAGFEYNPSLVAFYNDDSLSGSGRSSNPSNLDDGEAVTLDIGETPVENYSSDLLATCSDYKDVALIVFTRIGGEGFDMPRNSDGTHSLQLTEEETDLIEMVEGMNFGKVVVIINAVTTMELQSVNEDDGIDAILWIGFTGGQGILALGEVLNGSVNPSGKTVDTWASDFTHSPVWANFGSALGGDSYLMQVGRGTSSESVYFVDYEEGIYVGYRYYETRYAAYNGPITDIGESEDLETADEWYSSEVVWPFGYGLSYTSFTWELLNKNEVENFVWEKDSSLTFEINVHNDGDVAGKDIVELYVEAPYYEGGIEKSAKVLVGFAKTDVIEPGGDCVVEITVDSPYEFASYDYMDANNNAWSGYETEEGTYIFTIGTDAHNAAVNAEGEELVVNTYVNEIGGFIYANDPIYGTDTTVTNLYTGTGDSSLDSDYELGSVLSRADWEGTWPQTRTDAEKEKTSDWISVFKTDVSVTNRPEEDCDMPVTGANNGLVLEDLIGLSYDDPLWDEFMDQLTLSEMTALINQGAFHTTAIERLQVPQTTSSDGPAGFTNFIGAPEIYDTCAYPSEVVAASSWNVELLYKMGNAVGNEGLIGNEAGDGAPYSGWYAPGLNIHRSPFGGRNFEYYSEDSFLSGKLTAAVVEGCADKGVYVTMKHFALNEQETHRSSNGVLTWATEQSMREIYLKGFEIAIKTVQSYAAEQNKVIPLAIMSSFNRIGERWTGGDYRLLTTILRDEWGFEGLVISDFNTCTHMNVKDMFYAGGDLNLEMAGIRTYTPDKTDATDVTVFRQAAKNVLYVVANSNAMRGKFVMVLPAWEIVLFVADAVIFAALALWGVLVILRAFRKSRPGIVGISGVSGGSVPSGIVPEENSERQSEDSGK